MLFRYSGFQRNNCSRVQTNAVLDVYVTYPVWHTAPRYHGVYILRYPQLVTPTKNKGITLKIQDDERSPRRHILTVHIGTGQNTRGSSRTTPNLPTTQRQRRFQVEALKTELKHSRSRSSYKTPQNSSNRKNSNSRNEICYSVNGRHLN
jgi:hypothetical protein